PGGGLPQARITSITPLNGPAREYVVTAETGPGSGILQLDFINPSSINGPISDIFDQTLTTTFLEGEAYIIDRTPPLLTAIRRLDPNPTRQLEVRFEVEFNEPVRLVSSGDFDPVATGFIT